MTADEWLASTDVSAMWRELAVCRCGHYVHTGISGSGACQAHGCSCKRLDRRHHLSDRRLRLFACACVLANGQAVEVVNEYEKTGAPRDEDEPPYTAFQWADGWIGESKKVLQATKAHLLRDIFANVFKTILCEPAPPAHTSDSLAARIMGMREKLAIEIIAEGVEYDITQAMLAWNERTVPRLAQAIYDERAWERMPILADALEEAGCMSTEIIDHLRNQRRVPVPPKRALKEDPRFHVGQWVRIAKDLHYPEEKHNVGELHTVEEVDELPTTVPSYNYTLTGGLYRHEEELEPVEVVPCNALHARGCWVLDLILGKD